MDEIEWGYEGVVRDRNVSVMLHNLSNHLSNSRDRLEWVPNQPHFATDDLADVLWGCLSTIETLSTHGLLDRAFESGHVPGAFRSQSLLALRRVLGRYYPSVLPTDSDLAHVVPSEEPQGHDSIILPIGTDLGPMIPQFTPAPPIPEVVIDIPPPLTKSQRRWQRRTRAKPASESTSDAKAVLV